MFKLDVNTRERFIMYVIDTLVTDYEYDKYVAQKMVMSSALLDLLDEESDYVMHYSVEHWAKQVIEENECVCVLKK